MTNGYRLYITLALLILTITGYVCMDSKKSAGETQNSQNSVAIDDKALYKWVTDEKDYTYYKNNSEIIPTSEETERAHDNFMRTRLNKKALSILNNEGKLPDGAAFPDSSIIVKEIYSEKNAQPELIAVMVKLNGAPNSNKGWLWAEYSPTGETEYSVEKNGKVCVGCHKPGDDYVRILDIIK